MNPHGCEVQLLAWSNTSNGGPRITLQLSDEADLEYFQRLTMAKGRGKMAVAGQRLMAGFQEIGDDEKPAPEPAADPIGPRCKLAVQWCKDAEFQRWVIPLFRPGLEGDAVRAAGGAPIDREFIAAEIVRVECAVESRRDLDTTPGAGIYFDDRFRRPYQTHLRGAR